MATPHRLRHHVGVFRSVPAYMHEAMVAAYVRDATFAPMDDEPSPPTSRPGWGRRTRRPSTARSRRSPALHRRSASPLGGIERPVLILWGEEER